MTREEADRRLRWIAWSQRVHLRPLVVSKIVRAAKGEPPRLPLDRSRLPEAIRLRPAERETLLAERPGPGEAKELLEQTQRSGVEVLVPGQSRWLDRLWKEMVDPPPALYVCGSLFPTESPAIAVIGARHATGVGLDLARRLSRDLAAAGIVVISGLALGIDAAAHLGALDMGGRTVAVLGCGVDQPSPASHRPLAERVAQSGALVSEFPPGTSPRPVFFPRRNRILAAIASVVLVVEGGRRSGARSTVDFALSMGREVAAIPRDPVHEGSELPNELIRSGASAITRAEQLIDLLQNTAVSVAGAEGGLIASLETEILRALDSGSRTVAQVSGRIRRAEREVLASLAKLEMIGRVRRLPGLRFARARSRA